MKSISIILCLIPLFSVSQIEVTTLNRNDSTVVIGAIFTNTMTNVVSFSDILGKVNLNKKEGYSIVHPSFMNVKIENISSDTTIYLEPFVREIDEVEIISISNEKLFEKLITKYRFDTKEKPYKGQLFYKNTNWFKYIYKLNNVTDSASCSIEDQLHFVHSGIPEKSEILFSPIELNRVCTSFLLEKNARIAPSEISTFFKYDFSNFLNAIFTKESYFDEIGFEYKTSEKRVDTLNNTVELKFSSKTNEKKIVISAIDSTLISYQYRSLGKLGGYHYYFALFKNQQVQSLYEEKGYLFEYAEQNHQFISIHFGYFQPDSNTWINEPFEFSEIIKSQINSNSEKSISEIYPLYEELLK